MWFQLIAPVAIFVFAIISAYSGLDVALVTPFYDPATQSWPWREHWFTSGFLHGYGKDLVVNVLIGILVVFFASFFVARLRPYRKGAGYLILGAGLGPAIVAVIKASTHIYSPWDLEMFGGDKPHVRMFDSIPDGLPIGEAFPGGHASGGFAFVSLYFLLSYYRPAYRFHGLAVGLLLGGIFAITQEVRGAHFLSHDLTSLAICWTVALAVFRLMYRRELSAPPSPPAPEEAPAHR